MKNCNKSRSALLCQLFVLAVAVGCASIPSTNRSASLIREQEAVEFAENEVLNRHNWKDFEVVSVKYYQEDHCWAVLLQRLPAVPDGHLLINVSARDGKIIRFYND